MFKARATSMLLGMVTLAWPLSASAVSSDDIEYICAEVDTGLVEFANPATHKWRIVFVRFPQDGPASSSVYPDYAENLVDELEAYVTAMSRGNTVADVEIALDPGNPTRPWTADYPAADYAYNGGCEGSGINWVSTDTLNVEIMTKIHEAYPAEGEEPLYWEDVDVVVMIQYDNATFNRCGIGGIGGRFSGLRVQSLVPGFVEGLAQVGTTQHLFLGDCYCDPRDEDDFENDENPRLEAGVGHEIGHSFGFAHTPFTGNDGGIPCVSCGNPPASRPLSGCGACGGVGQPVCYFKYVNAGRYSLMRGIVDGAQPFDGLLPYHPHDLTRSAMDNVFAIGGRLADSVITTNVRNLRIPQIRSSRAKAYRVIPSGSSYTSASSFGQHFLLANHQEATSSVFDERYGGSGLMIWHMYPYWFDPELPDGRDGNGRDRLESNWCEYGDGTEDFWDGTTGRIHFSSTTNPSSNLVASPYRFQVDAENVFSAVGIENIRQAGTGTYPSDMIVDVYVDATQYVTAPNGGEVYPVGQAVPITWLKRDYASISSVDLHLSTNSGSSYGTTIASSQSNTGTYSTWTPSVLSTQNRVRLTSDDPSATNGVDASDADFTVWGVVQASVDHDTPVALVDSFRVEISWQTNIATQTGADLVKFYDAVSGGTEITPVWSTYAVSGTSPQTHTASFKITPCIPDVYYYYQVSSTLSSNTVSSTRTTSTRFKLTACLDP